MIDFINSYGVTSGSEGEYFNTGYLSYGSFRNHACDNREATKSFLPGEVYKSWTGYWNPIGDSYRSELTNVDKVIRDLLPGEMLTDNYAGWDLAHSSISPDKIKKWCGEDSPKDSL